MSADAWLEQEELIPDFTKYFEDVTGTAKPIGVRLWNKYNEINDVFSSKAQATFKKVPYIDRWSANAKVLMAAVAIIPPVIFTIFFLCLHAKINYDN